MKGEAGIACCCPALYPWGSSPQGGWRTERQQEVSAEAGLGHSPQLNLDPGSSSPWNIWAVPFPQCKVAWGWPLAIDFFRGRPRGIMTACVCCGLYHSSLIGIWLLLQSGVGGSTGPRPARIWKGSKGLWLLIGVASLSPCYPFNNDFSWLYN